MIAAIVPAAGRSERMGRPKLILPLGDSTVIAHVVASLRDGGASPVVVVSPPSDGPGAAILIEEARGAGASVVVPATRPSDMRASFELAVEHLEDGPRPSTVLLVPADSPGINAALVAAVLERSKASPASIIVPSFEGRRGHPIALPFDLAARARELPAGVGLNALVALNAAMVIELDVAEAGAIDDLDTPEDYRRWTPAD